MSSTGRRVKHSDGRNLRRWCNRGDSTAFTSLNPAGVLLFQYARGHSKFYHNRLMTSCTSSCVYRWYFGATLTMSTLTGVTCKRNTHDEQRATGPLALLVSQDLHDCRVPLLQPLPCYWLRSV